MIRGTTDLDTIFDTLVALVATMKEEEWSVDYTHAHAPIAGVMIVRKMPGEEIDEFQKDIDESTKEASENVDKIEMIRAMCTYISNHYEKLVDIGNMWQQTATNEKFEDPGRHYQ
ncbi:MAG TPA: hypothetical protein PLW50_00590 [Smithellaceae bacterium]|nr:hypothetical protein [Smithellaceae bacterium]